MSGGAGWLTGSLRALVLALAALAVPVLSATTGVQALALNPDFYSSGQARHQVYQPPSLAESAAADLAMVRYFADGANSLPAQFRAVGLDPAFFQERELVHMRDVWGLIRAVSCLQTLSALYLLAILLAAGLHLGGLAPAPVARSLLWGSAGTWALLLLLGAGSLLDFEALFLQFHLLSFSNEFWQLDPRTDNLIRIMPEAFFFEAALAAVAIAAVQSALIGMAAWRWRG